MGLCISLLLGLQSLAAHADEPAKKNELLFFDSAIFDAKIANVLAKNPDQIEIGITGHISTNAIPARLDKWMSKAAEKGDLDMKAVDKTEAQSKALFLFAPLFSFLFQHGGDQWSKYNEEHAFDDLGNYNVTIYYDTDATNDVTLKKVVLTHKP